jgi:hypothetical protein
MKYFVHKRKYYPLHTLIFRVAENIETNSRNVFMEVINGDTEIIVGNIGSLGSDNVDFKDFIKNNSIEID